MVILGIDPGIGKMGWGVIEGERRDWRHLAHGCIETLSAEALAVRLVTLQQEVRQLIERYRPSLAAVEELFFHTNAKTAFMVGQARGVILVTLASSHVAIVEYTPLQVKQAMTNNGRAEKKQVQRMIQLQFQLTQAIQDDAADALAIALTAGVTHHMHTRTSGHD